MLETSLRVARGGPFRNTEIRQGTEGHGRIAGQVPAVLCRGIAAVRRLQRWQVVQATVFRAATPCRTREGNPPSPSASPRPVPPCSQRHSSAALRDSALKMFNAAPSDRLTTIRRLMPSSPIPAVAFRQVSKTYGAGGVRPVHALDDVSFDIAQGEFFGLLGPNGAGKTSLISILAGLSRASGGRVEVMGHDVAIRLRQRTSQPRHRSAGAGVRSRSSACARRCESRAATSASGATTPGSTSCCPSSAWPTRPTPTCARCRAA